MIGGSAGVQGLERLQPALRAGALAKSAFTDVKDYQKAAA
jgi:hypothetical protein